MSFVRTMIYLILGLTGCLMVNKPLLSEPEFLEFIELTELPG
jgi:hypothetical protein